MNFQRDDITVFRSGLGDWERVWPFLERSLPYMQNRVSQTEIRGRLINDTSQVWLMMRDDIDIAAMLTSINGDTFMIEMVGGTGMLPVMEKFLPDIERYMKLRYGCLRVMIVGRMGWIKALKNLGYEPKLVMCSRSISSK